MSRQSTAAFNAELISVARITLPDFVGDSKYVLMIVFGFEVCAVMCFILRISALAGHVSACVAS